LDEGRRDYEGPVDELYYRASSPKLAAYLGLVNWLSPHDVSTYFSDADNAPAACCRPEQLLIEPAESSPLVVAESRFAGSVAEVDVLDERSQSRRRFFHRPVRNVLEPGVRVSLKFCVLLMLCVSLTGCAGESRQALAVESV